MPGARWRLVCFQQYYTNEMNTMKNLARRILGRKLLTDRLQKLTNISSNKKTNSPHTTIAATNCEGDPPLEIDTTVPAKRRKAVLQQSGTQQSGTGRKKEKNHVQQKQQPDQRTRSKGSHEPLQNGVRQRGRRQPQAGLQRRPLFERSRLRRRSDGQENDRILREQHEVSSLQKNGCIRAFPDTTVLSIGFDG